MINSRVVLLIGATSLTAALAAPARAEDVLTVHRLSAALAAEAVAEAVATCTKQGYKVTATIIDSDGVPQAMLRGDGASMTTIGAARHRRLHRFRAARAPRNEDTSAAIAQRMGAGYQTLQGWPSCRISCWRRAVCASRPATRRSRRLAIGVGGAPGAAISTKLAPKLGSTGSVPAWK